MVLYPSFSNYKTFFNSQLVNFFYPGWLVVRLGEDPGGPQLDSNSNKLHWLFGVGWTTTKSFSLCCWMSWKNTGFVINFWKQAHMPKKTMLQTWDNYIVKKWKKNHCNLQPGDCKLMCPKFKIRVMPPKPRFEG